MSGLSSSPATNSRTSVASRRSVRASNAHFISAVRFLFGRPGSSRFGRNLQERRAPSSPEVIDDRLQLGASESHPAGYLAPFDRLTELLDPALYRWILQGLHGTSSAHIASVHIHEPPPASSLITLPLRPTRATPAVVHSVNRGHRIGRH